MDLIMMFCPIKTTKSKKIHHQSIRGTGGAAVMGPDALQVSHNNSHSHLGYPSIDVGINGAQAEKQATVLSKYRYVTAEFQAEAADELNVLPGDAVIYEYSDTDAGTSWSHVLCLKSGKQGFVPSDFLSIEPVRNCKKKLPRSLDSIPSHHRSHHHLNHHHPSHRHSPHCHHSNYNHHQTSATGGGHLHSQLHKTSQGGALPLGSSNIAHLHHNGTGGQHHNQIISTQPSLSGDNTPQRSLIHHHPSELRQTPPNFMLGATPSLHGSSINKQSYPGLNSGGDYYNVRNSEPAYERYDLNFFPFPRQVFGKYVVITNFCAREENDLSVKPGEYVIVLNKDDPDWNWVQRECDMKEGFVPARFLCEYAQVMSIVNKGNSTITMKSYNDIDSHTYINDKPDRESLTTDKHSSSFQHI